MSFFHGTIHSSVLNMDTTLGVILPHDRLAHPEQPPKTLILLHGLSDNGTAWSNRTSILRYAEAYGIAVLIPEVQRSFYQDMVGGPAYFQYISQELPQLASQMFGISVAPSDLFIAGNSMGGYGALKCGLTYPHRFAGIGAFSAVCNLRQWVEADGFGGERELPGWNRDRIGIFGAVLKLPEGADLYHLAKTAESAPQRPNIFMACGTEDFLYDMNQDFSQYMKTTTFDYTYEEWPGIHEWDFWDVATQKMLAHFLR